MAETQDGRFSTLSRYVPLASCADLINRSLVRPTCSLNSWCEAAPDSALPGMRSKETVMSHRPVRLTMTKTYDPFGIESVPCRNPSGETTIGIASGITGSRPRVCCGVPNVIDEKSSQPKL